MNIGTFKNGIAIFEPKSRHERTVFVRPHSHNNNNSSIRYFYYYYYYYAPYIDICVTCKCRCHIPRTVFVSVELDSNRIMFHAFRLRIDARFVHSLNCIDGKQRKMCWGFILFRDWHIVDAATLFSFCESGEPTSATAKSMTPPFPMH